MYLIFKFNCTVLGCLFLSVCFYPINVKTVKPIRPKFFVRPCVTPGKVYGWSNFHKIAYTKFDFQNFWKSTIFYKIRDIFVLQFVHTKNMFRIEIEDGREAPLKPCKYKRGMPDSQRYPSHLYLRNSKEDFVVFLSVEFY